MVTSISVDKVTDPNTGAFYFNARIEPSSFTSLIPGMLAEVFLLTGSRTVLDYLLDPIAASFGHAARGS